MTGFLSATLVEIFILCISLFGRDIVAGYSKITLMFYTKVFFAKANLQSLYLFCLFCLEIMTSITRISINALKDIIIDKIPKQ